MSLRRKRNGTYVLRWYEDGTKGGRYRQETIGKVDREEAERQYKQKLAAAAARRAAKIGAADEAITFGALADHYLTVHGPAMAPASRSRAAEIVKLHLRPEFGERRAVTLRKADFTRYRNDRLEAEAQPATINREWTVFRAILNFAEEEEIIPRNPISRGKVKPLEMVAGRLVYFEADEWRRFITAFDDDDAWSRHVDSVRHLGPVKIGATCDTPRRFGGGRLADSQATADYLARLRETVPVFKALLYTGSRLGEILALTWQDVDLKRGVIRIPQPKAKKAKIIPISKQLRSEVFATRVPGIGAAHVFTRSNGRRFTAREVQRAFQVARKLAKLRDELTPHTLRHTFASWLAIEGTPIRTIMELLGHADIRMTIRYAHLSPMHLQSAVEKIGGFAAASTETPRRADGSE